MSLAKVLLEEIKKMLLVTLYFFVAFSFIVVIKMLVLAQNDIDNYRITGALAGALIMGKVVILLNKTKLNKVFRSKPLYIGILVRTLIYSVIADILVLLEHVIHIRLSSENYNAELSEFAANPDMNQVWIVIISSFMILLNYNLFIGLAEYYRNKDVINVFLKGKTSQRHDFEN